MKGYGSFAPSVMSVGYGGPNGNGEGGSYRGDYIDGALGDAVTDGLLGRPSKKSTTHWLARKHGVTNERIMYASSIQHETPRAHCRKLRLIITVGTSSIISPSRTGYLNTNGHIYKATSLQH